MGNLNPLAHGYKRGATYGSLLLKTGQTTQYNSELDDGYYEAGVAKSYQINTTGAQSGTSNVDLIHLDANTGVSFDAASKEIRGTGIMGVFKAAGGETIVVSGSASNNGVFTTASATADKIVLTTAPTNESAGAPVVIAKREAISNNTVLDLQTGLTWTRYYFTKFGTAGTGLMPWTGVPYDIFAACAAANAASLGGYTDWRVPNILELITLPDYEAPNAAPNSTAFPQAGWSDMFLWTSTTRPDGTTSAMRIRTTVGFFSDAAKTMAHSLILVRGGI